MYDRGSWEQLWNAHAFVKENEWKPLDLPGPDEIEGLELQVIVGLCFILLSGQAEYNLTCDWCRTFIVFCLELSMRNS